MVISDNGLLLICGFEGFSTTPYLDSVGVPTIGYGTTMYKSGTKVTMQDAPITQEQAKTELAYHIEHRCYHALIGLKLSQNQFDALCSLIYNIGAGAFEGSTVRRLANINPNDPAIDAAIKMWNKAGGKELVGLTLRRAKEADYYFS